MARSKIDYGIDLGTTNSAVGRMDNGEVNIIKGDDTSSFTIPSCVAFNPRGTEFVGEKALNFYNKEAKIAFKSRNSEASMNSFLEFKRTMGTDTTFTSKNTNNTYSSEDLSAEVLKKLKGYVRDEDVNSAVITVPARFEQNQLDATQKAAELAGFKYCELLQEPIAASISYGLESESFEGRWLVFDFGGGTFDVALLQVDEGIMKVVDTSGDNSLGGKNLNDAIIDKIFIPYLNNEYELKKSLSDDIIRKSLRRALKELAEQVKVELATKEKTDVYVDATMYDLGDDDNGDEIIIDLVITRQQFDDVVGPLLKRSIDISNKLLKENNLSGSDLKKILPVGGTTYLESLRQMIIEQISENLDVSKNPMTAVTKGAALFASTKDIPENLIERDKAKLQLKLKYPETTVEHEEKIGVMVLRDQTDGDIPERLFVEIKRNDNAWASGKHFIEDDAVILDIMLNQGKSNGYEIFISDESGNVFPSEPKNFTIINGLKNPNATLPYAICIDAYEQDREKSVLVPLNGLEKNQSLPAKGKRTFKILKDLRPGNSEDIVNIEVYEGVPGSNKEYNGFVRSDKIIARDIEEFIPKGSEVEITIEIDSSRRTKLSAYFPYIDETVDVQKGKIGTSEPTVSELEILIGKAKQKLKANKNNYNSINSESVEHLESEISRITQLLDNGREEEDTKFTVLKNIREISIELDKLEQDAEWPQIENELNECLRLLEESQQNYGNEKTQETVDDLNRKSNEIRANKNSSGAKNLIDQIRSLDFQLIGSDIGFWVALIKNYDDEFNMHEWSNPTKARNLIQEAKRIISTNPSLERIRDIVIGLFELLPNAEKPAIPRKPKGDLSA